MTTQEQSDRTARNVLELVQARRQLAAVRALADEWRTPCSSGYADPLDAALAHKPAPTSLDPREVPA